MFLQFWLLEFAEWIREHPWAMMDVIQMCLFKSSGDFMFKKIVLSLFAIFCEEAAFVCFLVLLLQLWLLEFVENIKEHLQAMSDMNQKCFFHMFRLLHVQTLHFVTSPQSFLRRLHLCVFCCLCSNFGLLEFADEIREHPWAKRNLKQTCVFVKV